jgi:hypothetical protein
VSGVGGRNRPGTQHLEPSTYLEVAAQISDEIHIDEAITEAPGAVHALEAIIVPSADDRL